MGAEENSQNQGSTESWLNLWNLWHYFGALTAKKASWGVLKALCIISIYCTNMIARKYRKNASSPEDLCFNNSLSIGTKRLKIFLPYDVTVIHWITSCQHIT